MVLINIFKALFTGFLSLLLPQGTVHAAGPGGDANALGTFFYLVPAEAAFETTPTVAEVPLAACPDDLGMQIALEYVGVIFHVVPVDGTDPVTGDLEWVDDSDSDTVANLKATFDFEGLTARVTNTVWQGWQVLDPGDTVNMEMTATTPDTAGAGAGFVVLGKILKKSG
jgi:hypothetical protein